MNWGRYSSWNRRQVLQSTGASAVGLIALSQPGLADEDDANVSVRFEDQQSDGESVVIAALQTDVEAELFIFESEGDRTLYKQMHLDPGTEFTDRTIDLDQPIPESQLISISIQPPEGDSSYDGARATVAVNEPLNSGGSKIERIEADPDAGFNWPYLLYTPSTSGSTEDDETESGNTDTRPLIVGNSPWRGPPSDSERRFESARRTLENGRLGAIADAVTSPALAALIPSRAEDGSYQNLRLSDPVFERLDLQVLAMVEDARKRLADQPYDIPEKFHVDGFSSNGRLFDKFTALHPERINAISAGGNGIVVLPLEKLAEDIPTTGDPSTETLPWPIGVSNLPELTGNEFNKEAWFDTSQFWYIGAEDQDPDNPGKYVHKLYKGTGEIDKRISEIFGALQVDDRFRTSQAIFDHIGAPAEFTAYEGAGHEITREMGQDIIGFHRRQKHEEFGPQFTRRVEWPNGPITVDETLRITVSYENLGANEATATPTLLVDGETVETTEVRVASGQVEQIVFEYTFNSSGEYTISVDGYKTETLEVAEDESTTETLRDDATKTPTEDSSMNTKESTSEGAPGFGIVPAIVALGGISYLVKRRLIGND